MGFLLDLSWEELRGYLQSHGQAIYRAEQLWDWIYHKKTFTLERMGNIPKDLRMILTRDFPNPLPQQNQLTFDPDGTEKFLWQMADGELVESVLLHTSTSHGRWTSACLSSQAGCPVGCDFCATGHSGFRRNLSSGEILSQILGMEQKSGERISRVLLMGMGEPLLNWPAVGRAIEVLQHPKALALGSRRLTMSTIGPPSLEKFVQSGVKLEVALSLHAPNDALRSRLIPLPGLLPIGKTIELLQDYSERAGKNVTFEYLLLRGVNDQPNHLEQLVALFGARSFLINLLPYNPVVGSSFQPTNKETIRWFSETLKDAGIKTAIRKPRGRFIEAACGQLRRKAIPDDGTENPDEDLHPTEKKV
jgi:23S rRNA (adenine2503-C2)-methyltransferase